MAKRARKYLPRETIALLGTRIRFREMLGWQCQGCGSVMLPFNQVRGANCGSCGHGTFKPVTVGKPERIYMPATCPHGYKSADQDAGHGICPSCPHGSY